MGLFSKAKAELKNAKSFAKSIQPSSANQPLRGITIRTVENGGQTPQPQQASELAMYSQNDSVFFQIMDTLAEYFEYKGSDWIRIANALEISEYLVIHGSENCENYLCDKEDIVKDLESYSGPGSVQIQRSAKALFDLLQDDELIQKRRKEETNTPFDGVMISGGQVTTLDKI